MITPKPHIPEVEGIKSYELHRTVNGCKSNNHYTDMIKEGKCEQCGGVWGLGEEDDGENARPLTKSEQKNAEEIEESDTFDQNNAHQS